MNRYPDQVRRTRRTHPSATAAFGPSEQGDPDAAVRHFVRETGGSLLETNGDSDHAVILPDTARPTGFRRGGNTISVDPVPIMVYVTRGDGQVERWPQVTLGCA